VLEWLAELAEATGRKLPVRLVKGAYWDTEIKRAQEAGLAGYPVFTRKVCTDVSYLACAKLMLARRDVFYPQFATHNAHTLAAVSVMAGDSDGYEFQRLHGMGQALYGEVLGSDKLDRPCRIYAPVGSHEDLLAYLVRRLLENGANTSFVNRLADDEAPIEDIIADPVREIERLESIPHPSIPLPGDIFAPRANSRGAAAVGRCDARAAGGRDARPRFRGRFGRFPSWPERRKSARRCRRSSRRRTAVSVSARCPRRATPRSTLR
jgi:RHH-type transcriptional regulator, proline utilization regulon repressor / proline dehydrogenase / delta 1-pyrroline-5-carboxylate dehydrogenase